MPRPDVSAPTEALYTALGPQTDGDEARDWPLLRFCDALCRAFVEQIWVYVTDTDDGPGWAIALDPERAPVEALPWLAQLVGVELTAGLTEAEQRQAIIEHAGFARGTPAAMIAAVQRTLTGTKSVSLEERPGDNAYQLNVTTLPVETPSAALTERAIISQKPIGIVHAVASVPGQTWAQVVSRNATWAAVDATFPSWTDVILEPA